jgi:glycosyltransferase involved in cell wall biosynthesis
MSFESLPLTTAGPPRDPAYRTPRRLLVVADNLIGGLGGAAIRHVEWFRSEGWVVQLAAPVGEPNGLTVDGHIPVAIPRTVRSGRGLLRAARQLRRLRRTFRPDIVHCHGARSFVVSRLSGGRAPFVTLHAIQPISSDPRGYQRVRVLGLSAVPLAAAGAFSVFPDPPRGWVFTPHASHRLSSLPRLGRPTGTRPTFLWMGALDEPKQPELFVRAMAGLGLRRPDVCGLMAGSGPLADRLADLVAATGAPVQLLGHRSDLQNLLSESWAVVLFSGSEGIPFSLEEAMWAGRTVVCSTLVGTCWLVGDDGGLLADDETSAVDVLERLCDRAETERLGEAAAERIRQLLKPDDPWPIIDRAYNTRT